MVFGGDDDSLIIGQEFAEMFLLTIRTVNLCGFLFFEGVEIIEIELVHKHGAVCALRPSYGGEIGLGGTDIKGRGNVTLDEGYFLKAQVAGHS